jgi:hypothetical protein
VVIEELAAQFGDGDGRERQQGRRVGRELGVDLGSDAFGIVLNQTHVPADRLTIFAIVEPPGTVV